jgi:hypothetical protein
MKKDNDSNRVPISANIEAKLMLESRRMCNYCWTRKAVHIHHIVPVSKGGDNSEDNLILLCHECHSEVHTTHYMERNIRPETLRLFKETWLDLVRRYPLLPSSILNKDNDIETIRIILKLSDRRALYYPLNINDIASLFDSLDEFRKGIQGSGWRLINDEKSKEHIDGIYNALLEVESIKPSLDSSIEECFYGSMGRSQIELFEIRRKTIHFHINELCRMIARPPIYGPPPPPPDIPSCFKRYSEGCSACLKCEFIEECKVSTI